MQKDKKIDYSNYYWQNGKVRLCPFEDKEGEEDTDSEGLFLLTGAIPPPGGNGDEEYSSNEIGLDIKTLEDVSVGRIHLHGINTRMSTFNIGVYVYREYRGNGYGTSAMEIMLEYAFNEMNLHKFQTFVIEGNTASEALLKKLGCIKEGVIREAIFHKGKYLDEIHYGLLAKENNKIR